MAENDKEVRGHNNIITKWWITVLFYIVYVILLLGSVMNIIFLTRFGEIFKSRVLKRFGFLNIMCKILVWISIIAMPLGLGYIFTKFYVYGHDNLF